MSRVRQELSIVQFQVENRQASASMDALRERAKKLNEDITATNASIKALGNVAPDNAGLLAFQKTLKGLNSDLRDVTRAQNELMKGVKAADKLWKAAATGTMESLSVKEIKAGQRGIQTRMQNLQPTKENARELQAMKIAIEEGEIAMRKFAADSEQLVKTIRDGGSVSSSTLSKAKTDLQGLLDVLPNGTKEWDRYNQQLTTVSEKLRELTVEQQRATGKDTLGRAFRGDFAGADAKTLEQTITKLKEYQSVIDDPRGKGERHFAAAETQIKQLQNTLDQLKGKYTSADEVIQRFNQHLGETKMEHVNTQAQTLAQTLDEKLSQATSIWDEDIRRETEYLNEYEQELKEAQERLASLQAEYDKVQQRYQNRSVLGKATLGKRDKERMAELEEEINGGEYGEKKWVEKVQEYVRLGKENLQLYKEKKAEALGLTETVEQLNQAELQGEEKKQEARRMTREQMQQGIKVLEDEAFTIDRTTAEGKARYEQLRQTIDQMNEEIKVAANEMMSFADAQALADKAMEEQALTTKTGWAASTEELKRAEQTLAEKVAKAKRGTAEEEAAYQKLVRQLQAVRTELGAGSMSGKQMMDVLSNPKNVTSVDTLKAAISRARQELDALGRRLDQARQSGQMGEVKKLQKVYDDLAESVQKTDFRMKELQNSSKGTASAFDKAWSRLKTYVGLYVGAAVAMQKLSQAMGDLMELSDKMGEVRKTTGFTADEVGRLSSNLAKLDTRTTLTQLMELASEAGTLGLKTEQDVRGFTEAANMLMVALPEMGREAAKEMLKVAMATGELDKIRKQIDDGLIEGSSATAVAMTKIGSTIDQLRANSAAAAPQITDFVKRVGAVGAQSGISIEKVAALGATVDALGMRVEMAGTALSRMIPAIKNNAYAIGKAIGVTQSWIDEQFRAGNGMEVILQIFDHIREANLDSDGIEAMFGGSMQDIMKELNQQGARAGIVFAGLAQGVDQLRENLVVANQAYEENFAIIQEYDKMNNTLPAKWARLKNQIEEVFVNNTGQGILGGIIDTLRVLVDVITGKVSPALKWLSGLVQTFITYWMVLKTGLGEALFVKSIAGMKSMGSGLKNLIDNTKRYIVYSKLLARARSEQALATTAVAAAEAKQKVAAIEARMAQEGLNKAMIANVWMALGTAIAFALTAIWDYVKSLNAVEEAWEEAKLEAQAAVERFEVYNTKLKDTRATLEQTQAEHTKLSAEVDRLRNSTDKGTEATEKLKNMEEQLENSENALTKAKGDHRTAIAEMNSIYGKYLNYLLTEENYARLAAAAHDQVAAAIRREMLAKQQSAAIDKVDSEYSERITKDRASFRADIKNIGKLDGRTAAELEMEAQGLFSKDIRYDPKSESYIINPRIKNYLKSRGVNDVAIKRIYQNVDYVAAAYMNMRLQEKGVSAKNAASITGVGMYDIGRGRVSFGEKTTLFASNFRANYADTHADRMKDRGDILGIASDDMAVADAEVMKASAQNVATLQREVQQSLKIISKKGASKNEIDLAYGNLANALEGLDGILPQLDVKTEATTIRTINNLAKDVSKKVDTKRLEKARSKIHQTLFQQALGGGTDESASTNLSGAGSYSGNPYGSHSAMDSYDKWDSNALLERKKKMLEYVKSLSNGADVQAVLSADAKFIDEAQRKGIKDVRGAIEWYNSERMKIQKELEKRNLTPEGAWANPSKRKDRKKQQVYSESAVAELDRYYEWRKEEIERQRAEEEISEAEYNRRLETMEQEHLQKRSDLRRTFTHNATKEEKRDVENFWKWWKSVKELDQDVANEGRTLIAAEFKVATKKDKDYNDRDAQRDLASMRAIAIKRIKEIENIINKENPYVGITEELRKNLGTMNALLTDIEKEEERTVEKEIERTMFILEQSTKGYALTWEELMREMAKRGWQAWADAVNGDTQTQERLMHQVYRVFDKVQEAIKKEASLWKNEAENMWNNILLPGGDGKTTIKDAFEQTIGALGIEEGRVSRANSLIGAGQASERVADRLAIQQMKVQLAMQQYQYSLVRKIGREKIESLRKEARENEAIGNIEKARQARMQAQNAEMALNLATRKEQTEELKQQEAIIAKTEESEARLYKELREWANLLTSSLQSVFEASHAGDAEYYNELAKLNLTGKGGPGAGTYIVIDNEGTSDATAHYEYLDEREALKRQHEIARENAQAEAWKKVMDDINTKMSETITDQLNAMLQNQSLDANTQATIQNTQAMLGLTGAMGSDAAAGIDTSLGSSFGLGTSGEGGSTAGSGGDLNMPPAVSDADPESYERYAKWVETYNAGQESMGKKTKDTNTKIQQSTQSMFAKMTMATNMYGIAYQTMSNDNLSTTQKFEMMALQAVGNYAIGALTTEMAAASAKAATDSPGVLGKLWKELGWAAAPVFAIFTGLLGGLMGLASSKIGKAKSTISQATGASASAGRLSTGMLTYAEGNVNEFTDPSTLREGRQYNVDAADGRTYRARYMGRNPRTHLTNGPEFHLSGERGREMIIDAGTTRQITMNEGEIWHAIQTLSGGGRISALRRRGRGVRAFADGNVSDFSDYSEYSESATGGMSAEQAASLQASIDRQNDLLERLATDGIEAFVSPYGKRGIVAGYDKYKKEAMEYGVKY